jgi:hypothetical protein
MICARRFDLPILQSAFGAYVAQHRLNDGLNLQPDTPHRDGAGWAGRTRAAESAAYSPRSSSNANSLWRRALAKPDASCHGISNTWFACGFPSSSLTWPARQSGFCRPRLDREQYARAAGEDEVRIRLCCGSGMHPQAKFHTRRSMKPVVTAAIREIPGC